MTRMMRLTLACALAVGLLAGLLAPAAGTAAKSSSEPPQPQATATKVVPKNKQSSCKGTVTSTLSTSNIRMCDEAEVVLNTSPVCPACPGGIHVVYVQVDVAFEADWMVSESVASLKQLESYRGQEMRVGVVHYNSQSVRRVQPMTDNLSRAYGALRGPQNGHDPHGDFVGAARMALSMLQDARKMHDKDATTPDEKPCEFVIFFASTKSAFPQDEENIREAGNMITRSGVTLMAGCPESNVGDYCRATKDMPNPRNYYTEAPDGGGRLRRYVGDEMDQLLKKTGLSSISLWQSLPEGLQYVDGSASEAPKVMVQPDKTVRLVWDWIRLTRTEPHTVTYRVKPLAEGNWPMSGMVTMKDRDNKVREMALPDHAITVEGDCAEPTPTEPPTPTDTPVPTDTPTPTATNTPTPTNTATPTNTPTRVPRPIYLPIIIRESCTETSIYSDVVLVLDMSTSMNRAEAGGRTKLVATLDAAKDFLNRMDFTPDANGHHDRVAVVGFNNTAWIELPLSADKAAIARAIDDLPIKQAEATRLDLAFLRGNEALVGHNPTSTPVLIMLTDGLPNRVPRAEDGRMETTVLRAAQVAKDAGAMVYTIGIGQPTDIDPVLLRDSASRPENFFYTPDPEELNGIYKQIAYTFGCPKDRHDWSKPWPPAGGLAVPSQR